MNPHARIEKAIVQCDLTLAREEIAAMHRMLNEQARQEGGDFFFKNEYIAALKAFSMNPNIVTARALLQVSPESVEYFESCSPGGSLYSVNRHLREPMKSRVTQTEEPTTPSAVPQRRSGFLRLTLSLILATGSAYAFSVAADLLAGGLLRVYSTMAFPAVVTWSIIATILIFAAFLISGWSRWFWIPYATFGGLAVFGALVGPHSHDFIVAGLMLLQACLVWIASKPTRPAKQRHH
jgi:hypothetical protein